MKLETGTGGVWDNPSADEVAAAIGQLGGADDSFAILSQDPMTYIQTFGSPDTGYDLEYQAGSTDQHHEVPGGVRDVAEIIRAFQDYAAGGDAWRIAFAWQQQSQSRSGCGPSERQRGDAERAEASAIHGSGAPAETAGHRYAIQCPLCQERRIEIAKRTWFMYGFIFFTRYGSRVHIGCRACVRQEVAASLLKNLLGGWWCFPWGFFTPIVVLQNVLALLPFPSVGLVEETFRHAGIDPDDVRIDERGFTGEQRHMLNAAYAVLGAAIVADGVRDPREVERAIQIIDQLSGGRIDRAAAEWNLREGNWSSEVLDGLSSDYKLALLQIALEIAIADGQLALSEVSYLHSLASDLGLAPTFVDQLIQEVFSGVGGQAQAPAGNSELERACAILDVGSNANILEVKGAYRREMMKYHPDRAGGDKKMRQDYNSRAQAINWAYEQLAQHAGTGVTDPT